VRLPELPKVRIAQNGHAFTPQCAFRRVIADGEAVVRLEIGLQSPPLRTPTGAGLRDVANGILGLRSVVAGDHEVRRLDYQGSRIAELYARVSTSVGCGPAAELVAAGPPVLVIQLGRDERGDWPNDAQFVGKQHVRGCDIASFQSDGRAPVWLVAAGDATDGDLAALVRRLLRLHAEQSVLDLVLKLFDREKLPFVNGTPHGTGLRSYLYAATHEVTRQSYGGLNQDEIVQSFDKLTANGPLAGRWVRLENVQRRINIELENYAIRKGATVINQQGGVNVINYGTIDNSFNTFQRSNPDTDLTDAMKRLHDQVKDLLKQLPADQAQQAQTDLETLTEQAAKPKPNSDVLRITGEGLIKAATNIAAMATPIATTVKVVLGLLSVKIP
jgi:hypothetical protein